MLTSRPLSPLLPLPPLAVASFPLKLQHAEVQNTGAFNLECLLLLDSSAAAICSVLRLTVLYYTD